MTNFKRNVLKNDLLCIFQWKIFVVKWNHSIFVYIFNLFKCKLNCFLKHGLHLIKKIVSHIFWMPGLTFFNIDDQLFSYTLYFLVYIFHICETHFLYSHNFLIHGQHFLYTRLTFFFTHLTFFKYLIIIFNTS